MPQKTRAELLRHISYVTNLALALRRAVLDKDEARQKQYGAELFSLADGQPNQFKP